MQVLESFHPAVRTWFERRFPAGPTAPQARGWPVIASGLDTLIAAFDPVEGRSICVPTFNGKRGNPVLWGRRYFSEMASVAGDVGARHLIGEHAEAVCEVAMADDGVLVDLDTPAALATHKAAREAGA